MEDHQKHFFYFFFFVFVQLLLIYPGIVVCQTNVRYLPGFTGSLPFELETGYINVDEDDDVQLFYYFIKSERNPSEDPLIVWITGGPGCSSLYGLLYQIGPLYFKKVRYNGTLPTLVLNPNSWTKASNIIFLDAPVWSGFSYSRTSESSHTSDTKSALQSYNFLRKWLIEHPDFLSNPVYIGGDSYSGFIVPLVTLHISNVIKMPDAFQCFHGIVGIEAGDEPIINLKGYLLGNPMTHMISLDGNSRIPFAHGMGLISNEIYESAKKQCGGEYINVDPTNAECTKAIQAFLECVSGLQRYHVLEPNCPRASPKPKEEIVELRRSLIDDSFFAPPTWPGFECRSYVYMFSYYWANDYRVQKALNIRKGTIQEWQRCNRSLSYKKDVESSLTYHQSLSKRGYRSLIFSGDHDLFVPFLGTQAWIKSLNYSIVDDWRPWTLSDQVAGYTRTYANNMTFATLKGAGHTGAEYKPEEGLAMFKRWISHSPL